MGVSNMTLVKIAAVAGVATVSMGLALRSKINKNIKNTDFCKEALQTVRTHKAAVHLLGEPIRDYAIDVGDSNKNFAGDTTGKYQIPVKGSKQNGVLYMWINRVDETTDWQIQRLELEVDRIPDKRLILKTSDSL